MKKYIVISCFCGINFCILYCFGLSTFFTTISLYLILFFLIKCLLHFISIRKKNIPAKFLLDNVKVFFALCLILEAFLLFVLRFVNTYDENKHYLYLSPYKQQEQLQLRHWLGKKDITYKYTDGYFPNSSSVLATKEFSDTFQYNELGFRGKFPPVKKDTNEYRIIIIGDSFVEGIGTENDSTIASLLQKKLQADSPTKMVVLNGGISGSYPKHETVLFYRKLQKYHPDLVVMICCFNDPSDAFFFENKGNIPFREWLFATSRIYRLVYAHFIGFEPGYVRKKSIQEKYAKHARDLTKHIHSFQQELEQNRIDFICAYIPIAAEIQDSPEKTFVNKSFQIELDKNGLDALHLQKQLEGLEQIHEWYWSKDAHLTPKGYDKVATLLAEMIKTRTYVGTH